MLRSHYYRVFYFLLFSNPSDLNNAMPNLESWLTDDYLPSISPNLRTGICEAISAERWEEIVNAFRQSCRFGTGGIRGMMAFDYASIKRLKDEGLSAPILKGPNTINDVVLLRTSAGVAKFGREQNPPLRKMAIAALPGIPKARVASR